MKKSFIESRTGFDKLVVALFLILLGVALFASPVSTICIPGEGCGLHISPNGSFYGLLLGLVSYLVVRYIQYRIDAKKVVAKKIASMKSVVKQEENRTRFYDLLAEGERILND